MSVLEHMVVLRRIPIRVSIPLLFVLFGSVGLIIIYLLQIQLAERVLERSAIEHARVMGTMLSAEIEAAFRQGNPSTTRAALERVNNDRSLGAAYLVDSDGRVIEASRTNEEVNSLNTKSSRSITEWLKDLPSETVSIAIENQGASTYSRFPIRYSTSDLQLLLPERGDLLMVHDLSLQKRNIRRTVLSSLSAYSAGLLVLAIMLWFLLRFLLIHRLNHLNSAAAAIARGEFETPVRLAGSDEIASLSWAMADMAESLRQGHDRLVENERKHRERLADISDIVMVTDKEDRITYVNPAIGRLLGYTEDEVIGRRLDELVRSEDLVTLRRSVNAVRTMIFSMELCLVRFMSASGEDQLLELLIKPSENGMIINGRDLTDRQRSRDELNRRENILSAVATVSKAFLMSTRIGSVMNESMETLAIGAGAQAACVFRRAATEKAEIRVQLVAEWVASGIGAQISNPLLKDISLREFDIEHWKTPLLKGKPVIEMGSKQKSPHGAASIHLYNDKSLVALPIFAGDEWWGFIVVIDCTEKREWSSAEIDALEAAASSIGAGEVRDQQQRKLIEMAAELESRVDARTRELGMILDLSPDGFVSIDARNRVAYCNPAFLSMTGFDESSVTGSDANVFSIRLAGLADDTMGLDDSLSAWADRDRQVEWVRPRPRIVRHVVKSSVSDNGKLQGRVLYVRDVTYETEVSRVKSEFLSTAAHELRTPLAGVYGYAELLLMNEYSEEERRQMIELIREQSKDLASLLNELLDLARIEARAGRDFDIRTADLAELVESVVAGWLVPNDERKILLEIQPNLPQAYIDHEKFVQALKNILSNAHKYSEQLHVEVTVLSRMQQGCQQVGVRVRDYGIGMSEPEQEQIFERFWRADTSGKIAGTGLGMSLVKEIMDVHKGQVEIWSRKGKGTTITLWLNTVKESLDTATAIEKSIPAAVTSIATRRSIK